MSYKERLGCIAEVLFFVTVGILTELALARLDLLIGEYSQELTVLFGK